MNLGTVNLAMKGPHFIVSICFLSWLVDAAAQHNGNVTNQVDQCPQSWTRPVNVTGGNTICKCGNRVHGIVSCDPKTKQVTVSDCYCVTYHSHLDELVIGACPYSCFYTNKYRKIEGSYILPEDKKNLSDIVCGQQWNREGQLCGDCKEGFRPPILSYDFKCIKCNANDSVTGWIKFVAAGILPPTILFFLVIILRLNINSPKLIGFILFAQLIASAPIVYHGESAVNNYYKNNYNNITKPVVDIMFASYGLFSLDFFYTLLPPFCIPGINTVGKLALRFYVAVYPLLLVLFVYILVELHARDVKIIVYLWKPFHKCFVRFRREGNIQTTIIDAFATIFLLSYVKILISCTEFMAITKVYNVHGDYVCTAYPYMSATTCWHQLKGKYLAAGIIGIFIILNLMVLPVILMLLYPMRCFRKCLGKLCCCRGRTHLKLQTFLECFHGYYKDGTNGTRDCRYVAGFYFLLRIVLCFMAAFVSQQMFIVPLVSGILVASALFVAVIRPYKERHKTNNITDPLFLLLGGLFGISVDWFFTGLVTHNNGLAMLVSVWSIGIIAILPLFYLVTIALKHVYRISLVQRGAKATRRICRKCKRRKARPDFTEVNGLIDHIDTPRYYGATDN